MIAILSLLAALQASAARNAQAGQEWRDAGAPVATLATSLIA
jgi:hypothetical protein